jgi:hypothetical protein
MAFRDLLSAADQFDDDGDDEIVVDLGELHPGERIAPAGGLTRGQRILRRLLAGSLLVGGAWTYANAPEPWKTWLSVEAGRLLTMEVPRQPATISAASQDLSRQSASGATATAPEPPPPAPIAEVTEVAAVPGADAGTLVAAEPAPIAPEPAVAAPADAASIKPEPLPPPSVDESDPAQKRAAAAGLHPGISKAVLGRLSDTDFKNAALAIKTALAATADDAVFKIPEKVGGERLALFEVRFVEGAAPDCRRYVVVVTKDRWSTTAPPMEKCGVKAPAGVGETGARAPVKAGTGAPVDGAGPRAGAGRSG